MTKTSIAAGFALFAAVALAGEAGAGTNFQATDFQGTNFQGTNFQGTNFQGTNFQATDFQATDFQGASIATPTGALVSISLAGSELIAWISVGIDTGGNDIYALSYATQYVVYSLNRFTGWAYRGTYRGSLDGMTFEVDDDTGEAVSFRIADSSFDTSTNSMVASTGNSSNTDVALYWLEAYDSASGAWLEVCGGNPAVFVRGSWDAVGVYSSAGFSFSCSESGVVAKCIQQWGYKPWKSLAYGPELVALDPLFHSCTRSAMADYCGNGKSHTQPTTAVDIFDFYGFNVPSGYREVAAFAVAHELDEVPDFILESIQTIDGSAAIHAMRYSSPGVPLECPAPWFSSQEDMWGAAGFLSNQNASQWNRGPYVAVRSDPVLWPLEVQDVNLNEGLMCQSTLEDPCPL